MYTYGAHAISLNPAFHSAISIDEYEYIIYREPCRWTGVSAPLTVRGSEGLLPEAESIPVSEFTSCGLILEPESIPVSEFTFCGAHPRARVYFCRASSLVVHSEKITVPKAWFTGSTCLALASSLEYILEVFLFYFSASFRV
ncbi:hypothetical protein EVAR_17544_1 [Eumeta japonica]|uniref:Uncharacterized protein n=1 Tax=Eumeta variegata TaxID=151549 RepID=A0A4C1WQ06_EUMVA|nr:hypothetical protein EVAR_17544_1 [Eumeta japonica]